jgi:hypothetical protein
MNKKIIISSGFISIGWFKTSSLTELFDWLLGVSLISDKELK